ncbi:hypothetical protein [Salininema proteolyticum]|uniref:Uncharacterized protein n=1 Tax=Salininema proteolyticum TaxID=1607685 RepID=A0ABV8TWY5_9ACTN
MTQYLSDQTWAKLNPDEARMDKRRRRHVLIGGAIVVALGLIIGTGVQTGLIGPQLGDYTTSYSVPVSDSGEPVEGAQLDVTFGLVNETWVDLTVRDDVQAFPGMKPLYSGVEATVEPDKVVTVVRSYLITDCDRAFASVEPLELTVSTWAAERTVEPRVTASVGMGSPSDEEYPILEALVRETCGFGTEPKPS